MLEISKLRLITANACWKKEECVLMLSDLFIESQISFLQRLGIITPVFFRTKLAEFVVELGMDRETAG